MIGKFGHLSACVADGEGGHAVAVVMRFCAGDEGVQAFEPVDETALHQRVEGAVDLQGRAESVVAELIEQAYRR